MDNKGRGREGLHMGVGYSGHTCCTTVIFGLQMLCCRLHSSHFVDGRKILFSMRTRCRSQDEIMVSGSQFLFTSIEGYLVSCTSSEHVYSTSHVNWL